VPASLEKVHWYDSCQLVSELVIPANSNLTEVRGFSKYRVTRLDCPMLLEVLDGSNECQSLKLVTLPTTAT
jgi:hypothetical protein